MQELWTFKAAWSEVRENCHGNALFQFSNESVSRPLVEFDVLNDNLIKGLISCVKYMSMF
jgi:hypothetical protein